MKLNNFNTYLADKLSSFMSTMTLFWVLLILDITGAIFDPPSTLQGWLLWGVSIFFQSVALPILAFVSNKQSERVEQVLNETHSIVYEELGLIKLELSIAKEDREALKKLVMKQFVEELQEKVDNGS